MSTAEMETSAAVRPRAGPTALWRRLLLSERLVLWLCLAWFLAVLPFAPAIASPENLGNLLSSLLPLLLAAVGQTFVLIAGGIDLSVTAVLSLASILGALVMSGEGGLLAGSALAAPAGVAAMLLAGAGVGALNGAAIVLFSLPPFMVTLTSLLFFGGLAVWVTRSSPLYLLPPGFLVLGQDPWVEAVAVTVLVAGAAALLRGSLAGRWLYAVGRSPKAAALSGVPVRAVTAGAYVASGLFAAAASVLYTARLETGDPVLGRNLLLDIVAAAVIGGNSLFGGKGKISFTLSGVLFIALLDDGLTLLDLSPFSILLAKGLTIALAALLDAARNRVLAES